MVKRLLAILLLVPGWLLAHPATGPIRSPSQRIEDLTTQPPSGESAEAYRLLAAALAAIGREMEALRCLDAAIRLDPASASAFACRAAIRRQHGQTNAACHDLDEAIRLDDRDAELFVRRAGLRRIDRRLDLALSDLATAIALRPSDGAIFAERGRVRLDAHLHAAAQSDFADAERLGIASETLAYDQGRALIGQGELEKAIRTLDVAVRFAPSDERPLIARGEASERRGDWATARDDYERAAALHPDTADPDANLHLAWLLATCPVNRLRDGARAVKLAEVYFIGRSITPPRVLAVLAAARAEVGEFAEAIEMQTQALKDRDYARTEGSAAKARLERYRERKPWRTE